MYAECNVKELFQIYLRKGYKLGNKQKNKLKQLDQ